MKRRSEPSTWAGVAALVALISPELAELAPELVRHVATAAGSIAAVVAIIRRESRRG